MGARSGARLSVVVAPAARRHPSVPSCDPYTEVGPPSGINLRPGREPAKVYIGYRTEALPSIDRRASLTALGAGIAAVSGCSEGGTTATPTRTPSQESTDPTPTPAPAPRIPDAGLLVDQGSFTTLGDLRSVGRGAILFVGVECELPVDEGAASGLVEVRVADASGSRIPDTSGETSAVVEDGSECSGHQLGDALDTTSWDLGSYTAEVLVNSDQYGTTTTTEVPFDVVEPLGPGAVELRLAEFPESVVARESFDWTLGFRNRSDRDSSVVTDTVTLETPRDESLNIDVTYRENIPAGEEILVDLRDNQLNYPGSYTYRIEEIDAEVSFTVESAD